MYLPQHFRERRTEVLHDFIARHPLGMLVTNANGAPVVDHVPMLLVRDQGANGMLQGHVARANPLWRTTTDGAEVLVVFRGADAPEDYVRAMLRAIVGFEIEITDLVGKFKASQNRSAEDRAGVRGGLGAAGKVGLDELVRDPD